MATNYTWSITSMQCIPQTPEGADYVITANWKCVGVEDEYSSVSVGTVAFEVVQGEQFTPYADLTEAQVLGWCYANGVDQAATEADIQVQIDSQKNPPTVFPPLPWG